MIITNNKNKNKLNIVKASNVILNERNYLDKSIKNDGLH